MADPKIAEELRSAVAARIENARVEVTMGSAGHYSISVTSPVFAGKSMLECHRLVMGAIAHLMKGEAAPVHAIDSLKTRPG
jgi:stress-induced morphogen